MKLLVYASPFNRAVPTLLKSLSTLTADIHSEHIASLESLAACLRKPMGVPSVGILMPPDRSELSALVNHRHLLRDMRIILVLPDAEAATMKTAHLLRPRYVSYGDGDLSDVVAVTSRMARTMSDIPSRMVGLPAGKSMRHPTMH